MCQGHRKPQEGGVDLETEKCRKKSIMKMLNILHPFLTLTATVDEQLFTFSLVPHNLENNSITSKHMMVETGHMNDRLSLHAFCSPLKCLIG